MQYHLWREDGSVSHLINIDILIIYILLLPQLITDNQYLFIFYSSIFLRYFAIYLYICHIYSHFLPLLFIHASYSSPNIYMRVGVA
jgi:hypothetical protein